MNDSPAKAMQAKWLEKLPPLRLRRCLLLLSAAMFAFLLPVAAIATNWHGRDGLMAALTAAGTCWIGSALALVVTSLCGRGTTNGPLVALLAGLCLNCVLPFVTGLVLHRQGGALAEAGVFGLMVVFFQFALFVETLLSLCLIKSPR